MTEIESLAIDYVRLRRQYRELKAQRNDLICECMEYDVSSCYQEERLDESIELCDTCKQARQVYEKLRPHAAEIQSVWGKLKRRVNRLNDEELICK